VLQWPSDSRETYDAVVEIEDLLIEAIQDECAVDGHDVGSGEMNIFIWTDDPPSTFDQVTAAISTHALWAHLRAAFRAEGQDDYTVIWPEGLSDFKIA
jgi:hypothetical protein